MQTQHSPFTEADYDFSDVKSDELEACFFYEFSRESSAARNEAVSARNQINLSKGKAAQIKFGPRVQDLVHSHILMDLAITNGFPETPWRCLSDKDRRNFLKMWAL